MGENTWQCECLRLEMEAKISELEANSLPDRRENERLRRQVQQLLGDLNETQDRLLSTEAELEEVERLQAPPTDLQLPAVLTDPTELKESHAAVTRSQGDEALVREIQVLKDGAEANNQNWRHKTAELEQQLARAELETARLHAEIDGLNTDKEASATKAELAELEGSRLRRQLQSCNQEAMELHNESHTLRIEVRSREMRASIKAQNDCQERILELERQLRSQPKIDVVPQGPTKTSKKSP